MSLVLTNKDGFEYSEERRLFYVAITRARNTTYLISPDRNYSVFIDEIKEAENVLKDFNPNENTIQNNPKCPKCQKGILLPRGNIPYMPDFLGCSNYPQCDYTVNNLEILNNKKICSNCGGFMIIRKWYNGYFYGCTNYPHCNNKEKIIDNN